MNAKQRARWEITRTTGFWRYVLLYWVIIWGGTMAGASYLIDYLFGNIGLGFGFGLGLKGLAIRIPLYLVSGFAAGTIVWLIGEHNYRSSR